MENYRCYAFLAFVFMWDVCSAVSNGTQFEPAFVPEPRGRGTLGIFWSCIITLGLCVWTSVHPNIISNPTTSRVMVHKVVWMLLALLAPEVILGIAYDQRKQAKEVHGAWCKHFGIKPGSLEDNMGREGAFFVIMGGFVVPGVPSAEKNSEEDGLTCHRALTGDGFLYYLSKGQIEMDAINKRVIVDKGKADIVAKFLVCLQALWMAVQCAARKASGLPITLLELHVVIQVLFALLSYTQWAYKPLNANESIILSLQGEIGIPPEDSFIQVKIYLRSFRGIFSSQDGLVSLCALFFTSGAHASAWNYPFPTRVEQVLWRVSSIALIGPCISILVGFTEWCKNWYQSSALYDFIDDFAVIIIILVFTPLYLFSIIFITVEAFISLRKVPLGTYDSVPWMDFWPHV